ncbi:photosynthetic complex putative assembly protein PuhB [Citromicrobium bathyomarinum]|uniref:photosynthetic complex putative assembly protein PuhB n=1 Tax=Citromicrobium bathyomarinum TaxID=72174 RepID=UPI001E5985F2|nr:PH domain-containing protein [Citromicrobium bathyomarinum]
MTARKSPSLSPTQIDVLWHPQADEAVLWQGRPDPMVLARSAFHTPLIAGYFALLALIAVVMGSGPGGIATTLAAGAAVLAILYATAFASARTTRYILTDRRVILHIGIAIEKTVNIPLKQIGAAHLSERGHGFGEIALEPNGERTLGYLLLWPHARPWRFAKPQPMLRALPGAADVAEQLARAVEAYEAIERGQAQERPAQARTPAMEGALA